MIGKAGFEYVPFAWAADDSLAAEHGVVGRWVEEALGSRGPHGWYFQAELKALPTGRLMLEAKPAEARRYVLAALRQIRHWDAEAGRVRGQAKDEHERMIPFQLPGWGDVWVRRRQVEAVLVGLLRRALPLERADVTALVEWAGAAEHLTNYRASLGYVVRTVERHLGAERAEGELREALRKFAEALRASYDKDAKRLAAEVEQLCAAEDAAAGAAVGEVTVKATPGPAVAGTAGVLVRLKELVGMGVGAAVGETVTGLDRFPLRADSPLMAEHEMLSKVFAESVGTSEYSRWSLTTPAGQAVMALPAAERGRVLLAAMERDVAALLAPARDYTDHSYWQAQHKANPTVGAIGRSEVSLDRAGVFDVLLYMATRPQNVYADRQWLRDWGVGEVEKMVAGGAELGEGERYVLHLLRLGAARGGPALGRPAENVGRLTKLIGDGPGFYLVPGEVWADAVNEDVGRMRAKEREGWAALLAHLLSATAARPSAKWLAEGRKRVGAVGEKTFVAAVGRWLPLVSKGASRVRLAAWAGDTRSAADTIHEENATCLRGMLCLVPEVEGGAGLMRVVAGVAGSAYRKVPGVGARAVKVGNAAVYALAKLGTADAVGQLAMLKVRVKIGTAQKEIEKAFDAAAASLGLPREEIEELGVPSYGMEEVGARRETFGEFVGELRVDGREVELQWSRAADGKVVKSVPAAVKAEHKEELKELQAAAKDVAAMLPAQAERIDSLFLAQKCWGVAEWRERYLDHPLVGTIARRLIWVFRDGDVAKVGAWRDGKIVGADDGAIEVPSGARVELWHPIGRGVGEVVAWREWLERHGVRQPFKQAHREVYLLTDAERRTNTYSNRFAAHVLRQHQFNALCAARGWKSRLRMAMDGGGEDSPASRELAGWGLRAEYWVEGAVARDGTDVSDSGAYLWVTTDQVRFYPAGAGDAGEPVALERVPALVFSEVMRDVDLFVGVASVGNDPAWADGGPEGRYRTYWQSYSFGELGETARTRKAVLEKLVPRLNIASRCSFTEKFLVVRGDLRTYKIHLGSGNILMEPNDQYLCIVPNQRAVDAGAGVFLPFEGDQTLSVIVSKAMMLAGDAKITDGSITRQIKG